MKTVSATEKQFIAKLINISNSPKENSNGTMFRNATVEFPNVNGELISRQAIVYEKNFEHGMQIGYEYVTKATKTETGVIIQVSHLVGALAASAEDFGF